MVAEVFVGVDLAKASSGEFKKGAAAAVAGGDENFGPDDDWGRGIGAKGGFPFLESNSLTVEGIQNHKAVGLEGGEVGFAFKRERHGRAVSGLVGLAAPDFFAGFFVEGESEGGFNDEHFAEHKRGGGKAPLGRARQFGFFHQVDLPDFMSTSDGVAGESAVFALAEDVGSIHGGSGAGAAFVQVIHQR